MKLKKVCIGSILKTNSVLQLHEKFEMEIFPSFGTILWDDNIIAGTYENAEVVNNILYADLDILPEWETRPLRFYPQGIVKLKIDNKIVNFRVNHIGAEEPY